MVGGLFPNDGDGNAWGDPKIGFPPVLAKNGYKIIDPGRYQDLTDDFTAQISAFKDGECRDRHRRADPARLHHVLAAGGAAGLQAEGRDGRQGAAVPDLGRSAGPRGDGLSSKSGGRRTIRSSRRSTDARRRSWLRTYDEETGKQWTQPLGFSHALFEVAADVLKRSKGVDNASIRDSLAATNLNTIVGPVKFGGKGPFKNVSKTPLVGGQWRKGTRYPFDLIVVSNTLAPQIPAQGKLELL